MLPCERAADASVSPGSCRLKLRVESRVHENKPTEDAQEAPSNPVFKGENSEYARCRPDKGIVQDIQGMGRPECAGTEQCP